MRRTQSAIADLKIKGLQTWGHKRPVEAENNIQVKTSKETRPSALKCTGVNSDNKLREPDR